MKKLMRRMLSVVAAVAMVLTMGVTAFAAGNGSITIQNTKTGSTYSVYKVFDATYNSDGNVAYSYDGSNTTFLAALQGDNSPFTVTQNTTGSYTVVKKADATAQTISTFLTTNVNNLGNAVTTITGNGSSQTASNLDYGYYYITTGAGSAVTIDSAAPSATVIDKNNNTIPTPDKQSSTDTGDSKTYSDADKTASIGDVISYKVTDTYSRYANTDDGAQAVTKLTFTDTMSDGLTANQDVAVKIGTQTLTKDTDYTVTYSTDATTGVTTTTITITTATVSNDAVTFKYADGAAIEITYSATLNEKAVAGTAETNSVELKWNDSNSSGTDTTKVTTYSFDLVKDKTDKTVITGAQFTLKKGDTTLYFTKSGNTYQLTASTTEGATSTIDAGNVTITGLGNGSYTLTETKAPDGYNKLTESKTVTVNSANNPATVTNGKYVSGGVEVVNEAGTELPSTGGMGTTIFYVLGAVLVIGAGVVLVTRRRVSR